MLPVVLLFVINTLMGVGGMDVARAWWRWGSKEIVQGRTVSRDEGVLRIEVYCSDG